jgi:hypothetical protein
MVETLDATDNHLRSGGNLASYHPSPFAVYISFLPNIVHFVYRDQIQKAWKSSVADIEGLVFSCTIALLTPNFFYFCTIGVTALLSPSEYYLDTDFLTISAMSTNICLLTVHELLQGLKSRAAGNGTLMRDSKLVSSYEPRSQGCHR